MVGVLHDKANQLRNSMEPLRTTTVVAGEMLLNFKKEDIYIYSLWLRVEQLVYSSPLAHRILFRGSWLLTRII